MRCLELSMVGWIDGLYLIIRQVPGCFYVVELIVVVCGRSGLIKLFTSHSLADCHDDDISPDRLVCLERVYRLCQGACCVFTHLIFHLDAYEWYFAVRNSTPPPSGFRGGSTYAGEEGCAHPCHHLTPCNDTQQSEGRRVWRSAIIPRPNASTIIRVLASFQLGWRWSGSYGNKTIDHSCIPRFVSQLQRRLRQPDNRVRP
jgi:hypothetical protein